MYKYLQKHIVYLLLSAFFLSLCFVFSSKQFYQTHAKKELNELQDHVLNLESEADEVVRILQQKNDNLSFQDFIDFNNEDFTVYAFKNGDLKYWSKKDFIPEQIISRILGPRQTILPFNENAFYVYSDSVQQNFNIYVVKDLYDLAATKTEAFENDEQLITFSDTNEFLNQKIQTKAGTEIGHAYMLKKQYPQYLLEICWWLFILFAVLFKFLFFNSLPPRIFNINKAALLMVALFFFKLYIKADPFEVFQHYTLFQPELFANNYIGISLGILFLNLIFLSLVLYCWYSTKSRFKIIKKVPKALQVAFLVSMFAFSYFVLSYTVRSVILDSSQDFSNHPFSSGFSLAVFTVLFICMLFKFVIDLRLIAYIKRNFTRKETGLLLIALSVSILISFLASTFNMAETVLLLFWQLLAFALLYLLLENKDLVIKGISGVVLYAVLCALYCAQNVRYYNYENSNYDILQTARRLSLDEDSQARFLLNDLSENIQNDAVINSLMQTPFLSKETIIKRIRNQYIIDHLANYSLDYSFRSLDIDSLNTPTIVPNNDYRQFNYKVYIPFQTGDKSELLILDLRDEKVDLDQDFYTSFFGNKVSAFTTANRLSYAFYEQGEITFLKGNVADFELNDYQNLETGQGEIFRRKAITNLVYKKDADTTVLVSIADPITNNSFLFMFADFFGVLFFGFLIFVLVLSRFRITRMSFFRKSLANQIQYLVLLFLYLAGFIVTFITMKVSDRQLSRVEQTNYEEMLENISADFYLQNKESAVGINTQSFSAFLQENHLGAPYDLHFFDSTGKLVFTNNDRLYTEQIWSEIIDPNIWNLLNENPIQNTKQSEKIDDVNYVGFYQALRSDNLDLRGILYLPALNLNRSVQQQRDLVITSQFNSFSIVLFLLTFLSLFISQSLTNILLRLRKLFSEVEIGNKRNLIEWETEDEIGNLVHEYNEMVKKLDENAVLLARSERESAWREVAKQVAHEIKNPLTPMKLSIQHLKRRVAEQETTVDSAVLKTLTSLEQQMQHLANIADNFSSISRMELPNLAIIDLKEAISEVINIYNTQPGFKLDYVDQIKPQKPALVNADKTMISRVLNNLLKNAQQAFVAVRPGQIQVVLSEIGDEFEITVTDNGKGISAQDRAKIFTPNFTTKTSGTGIGLMMSKKIIEMHKGEISFQSIEGEGTTFTIQLPKVQNRDENY